MFDTTGTIFDMGSKPKKQVAKADDVAVTGSLPSAPVASGMLPPPSGAPMAAVQQGTSAVQQGATTLTETANGAASYAAGTAEAAAAPVANAAVQYKNWSSAGGTMVTVAPGESSATIARKYGIPEDAILATNRMNSAAQMQPGSQIIIPTYVYGQPAKGVVAATAPTLSAPAAPAAPAMPQGTLGTMPASAAKAVPPAAASAAHAAKAPAATPYVVKSGDSLRGVAKRNGLTYKELAAANGLDPTSELKIGQKIVIPGAGAAAVPVAAAAAPANTLQVPASRTPAGKPAHVLAPPPAAAAAVAPVASAPVAAVPQKVAAPTKVAALPTQMSDAGSAVESAAKAAAAPDPEAEAEADAGSPKSGFRWPARGRVITGFGKTSNGESNDGINLAVPAGTPVKAADEGTVVYAGNELQGYGNLVLVRHSNGWVTAYAHNSELLVSKGDTVKRGQVISKAGATGNVTSPQLHFELRKGSRPVDPTPYLTGG